MGRRKNTFKLPKVITVCGVPYRLRAKKSILINGVDDDYAGKCSPLIRSIEIRKELEGEILAGILKHEIYHALLFEGGYDDISQNEHVVNFLAQQHDSLNKLFRDLGVSK